MLERDIREFNDFGYQRIVTINVLICEQSLVYNNAIELKQESTSILEMRKVYHFHWYTFEFSSNMKIKLLMSAGVTI